MSQAPGTSEESPAEPGIDDRVAALDREVAALRSQRDAAWAQLGSMRASMSWRVTWPLRRLARWRRR